MRLQSKSMVVVDPGSRDVLNAEPEPIRSFVPRMVLGMGKALETLKVAFMHMVLQGEVDIGRAGRVM